METTEELKDRMTERQMIAECTGTKSCDGMLLSVTQNYIYIYILF